MSLARWIGARAADVVAFFRDKPVVPCSVDWVEIDGINYTVRFAEECCGIDKDCDCLTTDTIAEFREWNARK